MEKRTINGVEIERTCNSCINFDKKLTEAPCATCKSNFDIAKNATTDNWEWNNEDGQVFVPKEPLEEVEEND